ncbi:hypothetical protein [uncultured Methanolobus sp.]|uniref:hypothetical protein n=1 Tax=uncultured Methanolobus sp. TaxID=218300 RepID=UPI002AAC09AC|nr:hypothetical protein [uncultured Methanolobus sp.]
MQEKRYPKGHFMATGIAIGLPLGIPIGIALGILAFGPVIGIVLGIGLGIYMEKKYNPDPLILSPEEETQRRKDIILPGVIFLLGIIAFIALLLMTN